jgi:hypothetical protein
MWTGIILNATAIVMVSASALPPDTTSIATGIRNPFIRLPDHVVPIRLETVMTSTRGVVIPPWSSAWKESGSTMVVRSRLSVASYLPGSDTHWF